MVLLLKNGTLNQIRSFERRLDEFQVLAYWPPTTNRKQQKEIQSSPNLSDNLRNDAHDKPKKKD